MLVDRCLMTRERLLELRPVINVLHHYLNQNTKKARTYLPVHMVFMLINSSRNLLVTVNLLENISTAVTFIAIVDPGMHISFLFTRCR